MGNISPAQTPLSVFVKQLLLAVSLVHELMQKPQLLQQQQAAACHLFLQIARIRRRLGFIKKKEFVLWLVLTLHQVMNGADVALLVGL